MSEELKDYHKKIWILIFGYQDIIIQEYKLIFRLYKGHVIIFYEYMPHVVISGKYDFMDIYTGFEKKMNKIESSTIIKYEDSFINKDKNLILIKTIVIEDQQAQSFYIIIMKKEQQITIRLDPLTDPKKTTAVKRSLGLIAKELLNKNKNLKVTKTNLSEFIV